MEYCLQNVVVIVVSGMQLEIVYHHTSTTSSTETGSGQCEIVGSQIETVVRKHVSITTHKNKTVLFFYQFWPGELCRLIVLLYIVCILCVYFAYFILYFCRSILIYVE